MKIKFAIFSIATSLVFLASPALLGAEFVVHITVVRYGEASKPIKNAEVTVESSGLTEVHGVKSERTDRNGEAKIRFQSPTKEPEIRFAFTDANEFKTPWYLYHHGTYGILSRDKPLKLKAKEVNQSLDGFPEEELADVFRTSMKKHGETALMASAVASILTLPASSDPASNLPDPLKASTELQKRLGIQKEAAAELLAEWQGLVARAPEDQKLDEKSLSALLKGDLIQAAGYAKAANKLSLEAKADLSAVSDTGRLVTTVYRLGTITRPSDKSNPLVSKEYDELEKSLQPFLPPEADRDRDVLKGIDRDKFRAYSERAHGHVESRGLK